MCRGNNHGGRRCHKDNAEGRRYRDKASKARAEYRKEPTPENKISYPRPEGNLQEEIADLKNRIYSASGNDESLVIELIAIGDRIAEEAETRSGVSLTKVQENYDKDLAEGMPEDEAARKRLLAYRETREQLKQSYIESLKEFRELGGDIETLNSDPQASEILKRTVGQHYPSEWIQASNESTSFAVRISETPAYVSETCEESDEHAEPLDRKLSATYNAPDIESANKIMEAFPDSKLVRVNNGNGERFQVSVKYEPQKIYDPKTDGPLMGGRPIGKEWVKAPTPMTLASKQYIATAESADQSATLKASLEPKWVKPVTRYHRRVLNIISEDDPDLTRVEDKKTAVDSIAYHEFGHRMEEVLPDNALPRMEEAFLRARTGKTVEDFHSNMLAEPVNGYLFHDGRFTDKYVGREYMNGKYEVFTVGVEALFGKNYGSLSGQHPTLSTEDRTHKSFVLGVLATL